MTYQLPSYVTKESKIIRGYIVKRPNGLYIVTKFKPEIVKIYGTEKYDAYITYGDPVGFLNIDAFFVNTVYKTINIDVLQPAKMMLIGNVVPTTHLLELQPNGLYTIYWKYNKAVKIVNVCPWFIENMFGISELQSPFLSVHLAGVLK